jgi:hypothetical protein
MSERFWDHVAPLQASGRLEEGTMFGFRCVRASKAFVAMPGHESARTELEPGAGGLPSASWRVHRPRTRSCG